MKHSEISNSISRLKNNKSSGLDNIKNEMLKSGTSVLLPCLHKLFNLVFSSGIYPSSWAIGYISPIFKTGDSRQPENYRGIAINSNVGKLFNMVLNARLDKYLEENNIIDDSQIGFKKHARTSDHMFILKSLIDKYTNKPGGRLYTCFVDFRKAFDTVIHPGIKFKLKSYQIGGKFYDIISSLYSKNKLCVKLSDKHTTFFKSEIGVRQGDVLSPNLFKLFINDLPKYLQGSPDEVLLNDIPVECLMYADDIVLLSSSRTGLQKRLDNLHKFCEDWCLDLNISKTKVLIFNKSGRLIKDTFSFNHHHLEGVQHYRYLGVFFSASGIFNYGQDDIFKKSLKASFKLTKLISSSEPSIKISLHLYDHLIKPVVLYGSEIWGVFKTNSSACMSDDKFVFQNIYKSNIADRSQIKYLKYILGVNKYSSNIAVMSETGRFPMYFSILISITKYLYRLENCGHGLLREAYKVTKSLHNSKVQTWYSSAVFLLKSLGIDIERCNIYTENQLVGMVKTRLIRQFKLYWNDERNKSVSSGKLTTYFNIKKKFNLERYLLLDNFNLRRAMCRLRISAHDLRIESGRYYKNKILRADRLCTRCDMNEVEDEFHFLTKCKLFEKERAELFKKVTLKNENFWSLSLNDKATWLLIQEDIHILGVLAHYIDICFSIRRNSF